MSTIGYESGGWSGSKWCAIGRCPWSWKTKSSKQLSDQRWHTVQEEHENKLNSAEMRMLRWARGNTRLDHIINEGGALKTCWNVPRKQNTQVVGHCLMRERKDISAKTQILEVSVRRTRGRPKKRGRYNIQGDMKKYQLTEYMAHNRNYLMTKILAGPSQGDGQKRWQVRKYNIQCRWYKII